MRAAALAAILACSAAAQQAPAPVMVIAASSRDYLYGAGGTLAKMIAEGRPVYVLLFGNEEKDSVGLGPARTRLANNEDGERAARVLGVKEVLNLGYKSGEFGQISTSELRNHVMTMMRYWKPGTVFFPDWYIHYLDDKDTYWVGRMAEEAPYGGGSYFLQEMTYIGYPGYAAPEYYFYSPYRPYRPREGGEGAASLQAVDITGTLPIKLGAIAELKTSNYRYARETRERLERAGARSSRLAELTPAAAGALARAFAEELAAEIGRKHGLRYGEEFNHLGRRAGLPEHVREKARRR
jgi:LmbE family N-acetylglucosaminyl deacetylase